jgi:origin recognition complex subunit 4
MREIAYQLAHQTETVFNIPEEEGEDVDPKQGVATADGNIDITPPAAYLPTLVSQLTTLKRPVVVVLDGFDLFAAHPRQALLYCLLDTVQSCRVGEGRNGMLVVGVSCVVNCINLLEKRVKSRFSHRVLKVPNPSTFDVYLKVARRLLGVSLGENDFGKGKGKKAALAEWTGLWTESIEVCDDLHINSCIQHLHRYF